MNLKRISLIVLLLGLVLLLGCSKTEKNVEPEYIDWDPSKEYLNVRLKNNGTLYVCEEDRTDDSVILGFFASDDSVKPDQLKRVYCIGEKNAWRIFYDADWKERLGKYHSLLYLSSVSLITIQGKKDYLIFVSHNYDPDNEFCSRNYDGALPSDTLGTEPYVIQDDRFNNGFPLWIFDLAEAELTDDYELHFEDFVLTAADLRSKSWRNGDAPILK